MKNSFFLMSILWIGLFLGGCAQTVETVKVVWGSSTRSLEEARADAVREDFPMAYDACFREVLQIAGTEKWEIFIKDKKQGTIVVLGIPGNVDTTEVGIFLDKAGASRTKVEISSLSSSAKLKAADILFEELRKTGTPENAGNEP